MTSSYRAAHLIFVRNTPFYQVQVSMMSVYRYKADIVPTMIFISLFVVDLLVFSFCDSVPLLLVYMVLVLFPKGMICAWNHHHQHVHTFTKKWLNRCLEFVYLVHTGISTNAWVLHHNLGHHLNYLDQEKDESRWKHRDGRTMGAFYYTVKLAITGYWRAFQVGKRHPKYQSGFITASTVGFAVLGFLTYLRPVPAVTVFWFPMLFGYVITCWHTYYHHAGLDTDDHLEASYNIMHKTYNLFTGNLGYHTAHHMKQAVHWSKLPEYHEKIKDGIPEHLYKKPSFLFSIFPA